MLSNAFVALALDNWFKNTDITNMGDAAGVQNSAADGSLYYGLHSAWPGPTGDQSTSEIAYTGYTRVAVARGAGWTRTGQSISPTANVDFGQASAGSFPITAWFWSVGLLSAGAGVIVDAGGIGPMPTVFTAVASTDTIFAPNQSLSVDDRVFVRPIPGFSLPAGLTEGTIYWVKTVSGSSVTLSTTQGGATLDITADGAGLLQRLSPITVNLNTIPRLTTSSAIRIG